MESKPSEMTDQQYINWKNYLIAATLHVGKQGGHYYIKVRKNGTTYRSYT